MAMDIKEEARDALDAGENPRTVATNVSAIMMRRDIVISLVIE